MTKQTFQPAVKWSGSKRSQAKEILKVFPTEINTYYEPFCGGCSMLMALMLNDNIKVQKYVCSDLNNDLISLWKEIKTNPHSLIEDYRDLWNGLNATTDRGEKRKYFEWVRSRFNNERNPSDFLFIMRTTTNGMPRYNSRGEFNNSFHITRDGMHPHTLSQIILFWSEMLNKNNVEFRCCSFTEIKPENEDDFVYLDPPYANTKGMYYGALEPLSLFNYIRLLPCRFALSYDGKSGNIDNTYAVPEDIYREHRYIESGNSSFKRTIGKDRHAIVHESLYFN